jgi:hypothetical protein
MIFFQTPLYFHTDKPIIEGLATKVNQKKKIEDPKLSSPASSTHPTVYLSFIFYTSIMLAYQHIP